MQRTRFFLIGAPKAGTTALASWLREHPGVYFTDPKEPFYWAEDLPALRAWTGVADEEAYRRLFRGAREDHRALGEGSTLYLYSAVAVPRILERYPDARFLVLLRDPVAIAQAFHAQLCFHGFEDERDFEAAWSLQADRRGGRRWPRHVLCPELLQYREVAALGRQMERLLQNARASRVLVVLFDELRDAPADVYRRVLAFLDLEDDARTRFPAANAARVPRSRRLNRALQSRPAQLLRRRLQARLGTRSRRALGRVQAALMGRPKARPPLSGLFRAELEAAFREDLETLERLLGLDLSPWREPPPVPREGEDR